MYIYLLVTDKGADFMGLPEPPFLNVDGAEDKVFLAELGQLVDAKPEFVFRQLVSALDGGNNSSVRHTMETPLPERLQGLEFPVRQGLSCCSGFH